MLESKRTSRLNRYSYSAPRLWKPANWDTLTMDIYNTRFQTVELNTILDKEAIIIDYSNVACVILNKSPGRPSCDRPKKVKV